MNIFSKEKRDIPVFLHVPKSGGTYVLSWNINMFRKHARILGLNKVNNHKLKLVKVYLENQSILQALAYHPDFVTDNPSQNSASHFFREMTLNDFINQLQKDEIKLFSLIVDSQGFKYLYKNIFESIYNSANTNPIYYCLLRDPFTRSRSFYNYLKSVESSHELTHNLIKSKTFDEYLASHELEDSWLIRCINDMQDSQPISELEFKKTCEFLDNVKIKKMEQADSLINEIFYSCYELTIESLPDILPYINKNESNGDIKNINICDIDPVILELFTNRTKYDYMIYNKYCQCIH